MPLDVAAIQSGDSRKSLVALRDYLAVLLDAAEAKDAAPLARQLALTLEKLSALPAGEASPLDDLAARRAARIAAADVDGGAEGAAPR